jgi:UV DNA damage endonuclease
VLSSAKPEVVEASLRELEYHDRLLAALGLDRSHKIVLHVGSGASEPTTARARFAAAFERLGAGARQRLVVENDERWPLAEVLELSRMLDLPVVFDAFHHRLAPSLPELDVRGTVLAAAATWRAGDGRQEVHFSTQEPGRRPGAHAQTIDIEAFADFLRGVGDLPLDCVLEVKDKEQSALRAAELVHAGN